MKSFAVGDRVRIARDHHWAKAATGTIGDAVVAVEDQLSRPYRVVQTPNGPLRFYWVVFDEPQIDADGDGPYGGAEIDSAYLMPLADE